MGSTVIVSSEAEVEMKNAIADVIVSETYSHLPDTFHEDEVFREQFDVLRLLDLWNIDELDSERFQVLLGACKSAFSDYRSGGDPKHEVTEKWSAMLALMDQDPRVL